MHHTVLLQSAYVLHARAYRDTSLLLEFFTPEYGRVSAVAKGARSTRSRFKGLLQPFVPLLISWYGKHELMSLTVAEPNGLLGGLTGDTLLCGMYLNELLMYLLHRYDAHPALFQSYQQTLLALQKNTDSQQKILRRFEKSLLMELGYALRLDHVANTGAIIEPEQFYYFDPVQGLLACNDLTSNTRAVFHGESLLALHKDELNQDSYLRDAKRLLRMALGQLLSGKTIRTRELILR